MFRYFGLVAVAGCLLFFLAGCGSSDTPAAPGASASPTIAGVSPHSASPGATIIITGSDFSTNPADNIVTFNGKPAVVTSSTSTRIVVIVPSGATVGPVTVAVGGKTAASQQIFEVTPLQIAYVANFGGLNVSAFSIDAATGALREITGSPFTAGPGSDSVAIDPAGRFAYVANFGSTGVPGGSISAFAIAETGALTEITGSPFTAGTNPTSVTVHPGGKFAYAATNISAFTMDAATGALTAISGSPFATGSNPSWFVIDPTGRFAYVTNYGSGNVSAYTINSTTGALTPLAGSPFAAGLYPNSVAFDPGGRFAYVANHSSRAISAYTVDAETGALTQLSNSPFTVNNGPWSIVTIRK